MRKTNWLQRVCSLVIIVSLFIQPRQYVGAQVAGQVNIAGYLSGARGNFAQDRFRPAHLRYLQYLPAENGFKLLVDKGNQFTDNRGQNTDNRKKQKNSPLTT